MTLTLDLPPALEAKLHRLAAEAGKPAPQFALDLLRQGLDEQPPSSNNLPYEVWRERFQELLASLKPVGHFVDDSRESIYEGRGK